MRPTHRFLTPIVIAFVAACTSSSDDARPTPFTGSPRAHATSAPEGRGVKATAAGHSAAAHPPLFVGRFDTTDPAGPKATWPGTRILARFDGTAVSVKLSESAHDWMEGAPSYWEVSIDHGPFGAIAMTADNRPRDFELASGLAQGPHEVELYKRSEMQTGITQFLGFDFHGGTSLPSPEHQRRKIEVMGDSQATGFGIEVVDAPETDCPGADHSGIYQNFRKAWGALLGNMFDAEVHGIVYSGKGLMKNIWPTDTDPLRDYYPRANPDPEIANNPPLFDLSSWIPDVIVLTQGSIDLNGGVPAEEFRTAYRDFVVDRLRARAPEAHIFMGVLGKSGRGVIPGVARGIIDERARAGDERLYLFEAQPYSWEEMTGCNGHGTPEWHRRIAGELGAVIRDKVGW